MLPFVVGSLSALATWEGAWWALRRARRGKVYRAARLRAYELERPLLVLGAPDAGTTAGYPCGDITVDLVPSACPNAIQADVTQGLRIAPDSVVVFCACVLEYVDDVDRALAEIQRISGGEAFFVGVEPFTLAGHFYPGAKRTLSPAYW